MNENQGKQGDLVETTDCLEAIGVLRGWKNFLFVIVALGLLLLQISFWLVNTGWVKAESEAAKMALPEAAKPPAVELPPAKEPVVPLQESETEQSVGEPDKIENAAKKVAGTDSTKSIEKTPPSQRKSFFGGIKIEHVNWIIRFCNFALILAVMLYSLTVLFSLKVSLIGRLGGINHICRAFFLSLVMVVLLLPWQACFGRIIVGAIYTPDELARWCTAETDGIFETIIYYSRFTGYWAVIVLLLIFSQLRSSRWTKAILRRLEVI